MYAAGLLSQKTGMVGARFSPESSMRTASDGSDFYFSGSMFGEKSSSFGANLSLEEIADRYGLRD